MSFLPQDYSPPTTVGNYMKLMPGANRFRIMGSFNDKPPTAVMGWEAWDTNEEGGRIPVRFRMADCPPKGSFEEDAKHFMAYTVYNVGLKTFQILQLTQKSILDELNKMFSDSDWGNPSGDEGYDIEIFRVGEGKETKYQVQPKPRAKLPVGVAELVRPVNLDAFFTGEDPFEFELKSEEEDKGPGF